MYANQQHAAAGRSLAGMRPQDANAVLRRVDGFELRPVDAAVLRTRAVDRLLRPVVPCARGKGLLQVQLGVGQVDLVGAEEFVDERDLEQGARNIVAAWVLENPVGREHVLATGQLIVLAVRRVPREVGAGLERLGGVAEQERGGDGHLRPAGGVGNTSHWPRVSRRTPNTTPPWTWRTDETVSPSWTS